VCVCVRERESEERDKSSQSLIFLAHFRIILISGRVVLAVAAATRGAIHQLLSIILKIRILVLLPVNYALYS
jgi:hypothetical protein